MSFFESCLTVAIVSTITMIAIPTFSEARDNYLLNAVAREIAGRMQSARVKAIVQNRDCRVRVNTTVSVIVECRQNSWLLQETFVIPAGFRIAANAAPRFHRLGNASPMGTITVWNSKGRQRRVIVNISGRVRVE
jgi:hypothetical protein